MYSTNVLHPLLYTCATLQELRLGDEVVRGEDLLRQLDKARRKQVWIALERGEERGTEVDVIYVTLSPNCTQDAEAVMDFIAMVERHMNAHAHAYNSPYLEQRRRELAEEYFRQQAVHGAIAKQVPSGTTPAAAKAAAADAAMMPNRRWKKRG